MEQTIGERVDSGIIPTLMEYIKVPSLSPMYDPEWETNGRLEAAQQILIDYVDSLAINNLTYEIVKNPGMPPLLYGEVPATDPSKPSILLYGHMDKQPHFTGWKEGTGPTSPVIIDNRLYGRGGSDDGYALPSCALAIKLLQENNIPHGRLVLIAENEEESGSAHLMDYIEQLRPKLGSPDILVCLDSGIQNYDQLWITNSLRGVLKINVKVSVLENGQHSGDASGIVPDSFRLLRILLDRLEDSETGRIKLPELYSSISPMQYQDTAATTAEIGDDLLSAFCWLPNMQPVDADHVQLMLNRNLRPTLTVIGAEGLPSLQDSGNVIRPYTTARLSIRIPPGVNAQQAQDAVIRELERDPPYNATVKAQGDRPNSGWLMKPLDTRLRTVLNEASLTYFGKDMKLNGEGGSIHFIGMFAKAFPTATLIVTGLLGSDSNAHSANENLDIPYLKKLVGCLYHLLANA